MHAARRAVNVLLILAAGAAPAHPQSGAARPAFASDGCRNHDALAASLRTLADATPGATLRSLARTAGGRELWALTLASPGPVGPHERPAILLVGGVNADHALGGEIVVRLAERLARAAAADPDGETATMLRQCTLIVIPRLNPDGYERLFAPVRFEARTNLRPLDDDRDGVVEEDGPNDLNGDGLITVMRVRDPLGEWLADPGEPRLLRKADRDRGERGQFRILLEGVDDDGDGLIDEDPAGGVDTDRNWPHLYESGQPGVGAHQLSEPETRALAELVVAHPRIAAAVVYGRHDNLVNVPKGKDRGPDGESYRELHPDDVKTYEHVSEAYKKATDVTAGHPPKPDGALYAWLYSQRGIPTFALNPWSAPASQQPASGPASQPVDARDPPAAEPRDEEPPAADAAASGGDPPAERPRRRGRGRAAPAAVEPAATPSGDAVASFVEHTRANLDWLRYSDEQRSGSGFVPWIEVAHPRFGEVEVGGLAPFFTSLPPAEQFEPIVERQARFLVELSAKLPVVRLEAAQVRHAGEDLWRVKLRLVNDGYFPTHLAIARHLRLPGWVVRPALPKRAVVGGPALARVPWLAGSGGAAELEWIVRGERGARVEFRASHRVFGDVAAAVRLAEEGGE